MNDIEMPFTALKRQIDRLKDSVDKCFVPGVYVHTYKIASIFKAIEMKKLTESQRKVLNSLDNQTLKQFKRLSEGRCSCTVEKDI